MEEHWLTVSFFGLPPQKGNRKQNSLFFCRLPFEVIQCDSIRLQLALQSFFESQANDFCGLCFGHIFCPFCARLHSLSFAFSSLSLYVLLCQVIWVALSLFMA